MSQLKNAFVAAEFELRRSFAFRRLINILVLAGFPPAMMILLTFSPGVPLQEAVTGAMLLLVCQLSLLLWAAPIVASELESKTWGYHAVRSGGKTSLVVGRYLAAVVWTLVVGMGALLGCLSISVIGNVQGNEFDVLMVFGLLVLVGSVVYGAVFTLIGVVMHRYAMVAAVFYMVGVELILSTLPAVVNQFTVSFHLRSLAYKWLHWDEFFSGTPMDTIYSEYPAWQHFVILTLIALLSSAATVYWIKTREFVTSNES